MTFQGFSLTSLMMLLDISKLNKLENEFKQHVNGIQRMDFIK